MASIDEAVADAIAKFPQRWKQAVANKHLRGWFVAKVMVAMDKTDMVHRVQVVKEIDRRAAQ